jgi:hypothetical protein
MLGQELEKIVEDEEQYELARKAAMANLRAGFHFGGKIRVSREELH